MAETPIHALKEKGCRAQSKSYFLLVRTGEDGLNPIVLYNYRPTRAGENVIQFRKRIEPGVHLMADGYQGCNKVKDTQRCCRSLLESFSKGQKRDYSNPAVQEGLYCNKMFEYEWSKRKKD